MTQVFVVHKQTALERYLTPHTNKDFLDYLKRDGQNLSDLQEAHESHVQAREYVYETLKQQNISFRAFNLDELAQSNFKYFQPQVPSSGLNPALNLVIALGGDGTLLHASHYVGGSCALMGINSSPKHSVGHLCALTIHELATFDLKNEDSWKVKKVRRLCIQAPNRSLSLPLALNDVLICHRHPAATSRYQLNVCDKSSVLLSEKQSSSGIWIAAPAGSTAAIASYGLGPRDLEADEMLCAIREGYFHERTGPITTQFVIPAKNQHIELFLRMRQALIAVDGPDSSAHLGFGDTIKVSMPSSCFLSLIHAV